MRDGGQTGCVPRDSEVYSPIYKEGRNEAVDTIVQIASVCRQCETPSCVDKCPAAVDIPTFIGHVAARRFREAYETLRSANVLATICGYVCPAEVQCESGCLNQYFTNSIPIRRLQRWVSKLALEEGWASEQRKIPVLTGKKVAIIGAGAAGIGAATKLAEKGHLAVIFEKDKTLGGVAGKTIPELRLPNNILNKEIQAVINSYPGLIELRQGELGKDFNLDDLVNQGFDAIVLAFGLQESAHLNSSVMPSSGIMGAIEFLSRAKTGYKVNGTVYVLGGGNTAFDAALVAKTSGAKDVFIVYRRSFKEMPAWRESIEAAVKAEVNILVNTMPIGYVVDYENNLKGLRVVRTTLGSPDKSGRRSPIPIPESEHILPADFVIEAIGQKINQNLKAPLNGLTTHNDLSTLMPNPDTLQTSRPYVFAAGDLINGEGTVVRAVSDECALQTYNDLFTAEPKPIPISLPKKNNI
jgi:glutamate synthase (NADPH/NADH) small chain